MDWRNVGKMLFLGCIIIKEKNVLNNIFSRRGDLKRVIFGKFFFQISLPMLQRKYESEDKSWEILRLVPKSRNHNF